VSRPEDEDRAAASGAIASIIAAVDELLAEQVRYYRQRASEYDTTSRPPGDPLAAIAANAHEALRALGPVDTLIELGAGTGAFTQVAATIARRVVAVDASPEMLDRNRAKVDAANVEYVVADVYGWTPAVRAELVLFTFLLSHVPRARFTAFWQRVEAMLAPGGRVFLLDEGAHELWREEVAADDDPEIVTRTLSDGRRFRIVKVFWDPDELASELSDLGWRSELVREDPFYWGVVRR
jgi:SAM-dependent methyltransferase